MKIVKLKDVAVVTTGKTPSKSSDIYYSGGTIPFVKPPNLSGSNEITSSEEYVTTDGAKQSNIIPKHSIMVSCIGSLGKVGIAGCDLITNQQINSLTFNGDLVNYKYGYYFSLTLANKLKEIANSAVVPIVNKTTFSNLEFILRNLEDQNKTVELLDEADSLRQKRMQAIELLDEYLKSTFLDMFGNPMNNPKNWNLKKFGTIGTLDRGMSKYRPRNAPELLGGDHPLIQTGDVSNSGIFIRTFKSTYSDMGLKQSKKWPKGTLCITIAANIAKTGILDFDACFPDSVVGFVPDQNQTNNLFIHFWISFLQEMLERNAPVSAQKNINLKILRELDVFMPPIESQNKFAEIVIHTELIKQKMLVQLDELDQQFQALMQRSFHEKN